MDFSQVHKTCRSTDLQAVFVVGYSHARIDQPHCVLPAEDHGWLELEDVVVRPVALEQDTLLPEAGQDVLGSLRVRLAAGDVLHEVHTHEEAAASNVPDKL